MSTENNAWVIREEPKEFSQLKPFYVILLGLSQTTKKLISALNLSMRTLGDRKKVPSQSVNDLRGIIDWFWIFRVFTSKENFLKEEGRISVRHPTMVEVTEAVLEVITLFDDVAEMRALDVENLIEKCDALLLKLRTFM